MNLNVYMSTDVNCVNITTVYDSNPMNRDETFIVSLSSNDPKVFIPEKKTNTTVIIENSEFNYVKFHDLLVSLIFSV